MPGRILRRGPRRSAGTRPDGNLRGALRRRMGIRALHGPPRSLRRLDVSVRERRRERLLELNPGAEPARRSDRDGDLPRVGLEPHGAFHRDGSGELLERARKRAPGFRGMGNPREFPRRRKRNVVAPLLRLSERRGELLPEINHPMPSAFARTVPYLTITPAKTTLTIDISLIRMLSEGPAVSLKGSPTVSPTTPALWASEPLPP